MTFIYVLEKKNWYDEWNIFLALVKANMSSTKKRRTMRRPVYGRKLTMSKVKKIAQNVVDKNSEFQRRLDYLAPTAITNITAGHILFDGPQLVTGTGSEERKGLKSRLRQLKFKIGLKYEGYPVNIRLIGIRYPQGSSSPSFSQLLSHASTNAIISPWVKDGPVKYQVWLNKIVRLGGDASMASTYKEKYLDIKVKLPKDGYELSFETGSTQTPDKNRFVLFAVPNIMPSTVSDRPVAEVFTSSVFTDN